MSNETTTVKVTVFAIFAPRGYCEFIGDPGQSSHRVIENYMDEHGGPWVVKVEAGYRCYPCEAELTYRSDAVTR